MDITVTGFLAFLLKLLFQPSLSLPSIQMKQFRLREIFALT